MAHPQSQTKPQLADFHVMTFVDGRLGFDLKTIPLPLPPVGPLHTGAEFTRDAAGAIRISLEEGSCATAPLFQLHTSVSKEQVRAAIQLRKDIALPGTKGCLSDQSRPVQAIVSPYGKIIFTEVNARGYKWIAIVTVPLRFWADLAME